jgi:hypothetical protein
MNLQKRLERLEGAMAVRPAHDTSATFAVLVEALDRMAARKAAGCGTVQRELVALAALEGGDNGNAAHTT